MDGKIIEYWVVARPSIQQLVDQVNEGIEKGWQPLGGVSVSPFYQRYLFAQAMIKLSLGK